MRIQGFLLLAWALSACASAPVQSRTPTQAVVPVATEVAAQRPLPVWSVESPEGRMSHVLGTFHLGVRFAEVLPEPHTRALDEARVLMVEIDLTRADMRAIAEFMQLPPRQDLSVILGAELWPLLVQRLGSLPEPALRRLAPWAVMAMLTAAEARALETERGGEGSQQQASSLDFTVTLRANDRRIPVVALETVEEQGAMMNALPLESVVEYIGAALTGAPSEQPTIRELMDAYLRGDQAKLESLVFDPDEIARSPEVFEALYYARNERWLDRVEAELSQGGAFVAVGLAHVIGERGLLRLLEARGYRATRLFAPQER